MKPIALTVILFSTALAPHARAATFPYLEPIRNEILNQQVILSNAPTLDKKLATAMRAALTKIDKTSPTNLIIAAKTLSSIANTLSRSSLSNDFGPLLNSSVGSFLLTMYGGAVTASNRLAATFPSGPHTAAQNKLTQFIAQIASADANPNLIAATKSVSQAANSFRVVDALITKAENVKPPPAGIAFDVTGAVSHSSVKTVGAAIVAYPNNFFIVNGAAKPSIHGFLQIAFTLAGVPAGTSTVNITGGDFSEVSVGGRAFTGGLGTALVTYNPANESMFGSFNFTAHDQNNAAAVITVTGSFTGATSP